MKITGKACHVPVRTGTMVGLNVITDRPVTVEEVNGVVGQAAGTAPLKGVMGVLEGERVASRILSDPHPSIVDLPLTTVEEGMLLLVAAWYDSETGYATRLAETVAHIAG